MSIFDDVNGVRNVPMRNLYRILVMKPERKRPLGKSRSKLEVIIIDWIHLTENIYSDGLLWIRWWTFEFHKIRRLSWERESTLRVSRSIQFHGFNWVNVLRLYLVHVMYKQFQFTCKYINNTECVLGYGSKHVWGLENWIYLFRCPWKCSETN